MLKLVKVKLDDRRRFSLAHANYLRNKFVDHGMLTLLTLRAKGTLISEPRFSTPCEMRFFPREKGKTAFVEGSSLKRPFSLSRGGKIASRRG